MKIILAAIAALAATISTAQTGPKFPVDIDLVYDLHTQHVTPAIHTTLWHYELHGRLSAEWWTPVVSIDDSSLSLGSALVGAYSTGGWSIYAGVIGQVQHDELPHGGFVVGIRGTIGG